jgi:hypothetical protein
MNSRQHHVQKPRLEHDENFAPPSRILLQYHLLSLFCGVESPPFWRELLCLVCLAQRRETRTKTDHDPQEKKIAVPNCQGLNKVLLGSPANWRRARKWKKQAQRHRNVSETPHSLPSLSSPCTATSLFRSSSFVQFATVTVLRPSSFVLCFRRAFVPSLYEDK